MGLIRLGLVSAVFAASLLASEVALAHVPEVQVFRGGQTTIAETSENSVAVFRGVPKEMSVMAPGMQAEKSSPGVISASGGSLWLVDSASGKISVCHLVKTTQVGEHRVECHSGGLAR